VAVIAGGMGAGLYANLQSMGILAIVTDKLNIEEAAADYLAGTLENHIEYLH
jgi:predicted Fe-Mo cluster-binding NifX family protein